MKGKRRRTKKKRVSFSKLLLLLESGIVLYTTYEGFALAKFAVASGFMGTLPWIATMVTAAWGAYGTSAACYYAKAKGENTAGGVTYETVCRGQDKSHHCRGCQTGIKRNGRDIQTRNSECGSHRNGYD